LSPTSNNRPPTILVAEDAVDLREALVEILTELDYTVHAASDGYEAATMFQEFNPDLAILDMRMPMMNGADVCAVIRKTSDIPIIMFTSADDVSEVNDAILQGATDFVLKTTGMDELASRVDAHLRREIEPLKPAIASSEVKHTSEAKHDSGTDAAYDPDSEILNEPPPPNVHISNSASNAIKTFTVIIDPNEEDRSKITSVLKRLNQDFIEVGSAGEGLAAIQDYNPDIVVTEWTLPDMDAFKMFSEMKRSLKSRTLARIVMSDRLNPESHRKSNYVGINNFLEKPLDAGKTEITIGDCVKKSLRKLKHTAKLSA
jgi:DNA-binding response OmpR family regulator